MNRENPTGTQSVVRWGVFEPPGVERLLSPFSRLMNDAVARTARGVGWLVVIGGVLVMVGYIGYGFVVAHAEPPLIKWGVGALYLSMSSLLLSGLR